VIFENDWGWGLGDLEIDALQMIRFGCLKKWSISHFLLLLSWDAVPGMCVSDGCTRGYSG